MKIFNRIEFWILVLVFSISTLALSVFIETGRPIYVASTIFGHLMLVMVGVNIMRTRSRKD